VGLRLFTTTGKVEHIADATGAAGYTIETVVEGEDALELYSVLYNQQTDQLKVYDVASGVVVYDATGATVATDLGLVTVTGSAVNDESVTDQIFGSVGKALPVQDDESLQLCTSAETAVFTMVAGTGLNLGKLGFVDATSTPIMCQIRANDGTTLFEETVASVDVGAGTVTLSAAVAAGYFTANSAGAAIKYSVAINVATPAHHRIRFVSLSAGARMDEINLNRLAAAAHPRLQPEILATPGSSFNGLPLVLAEAGNVADAALEEVEPHKMNLFEGLSDAALILEASDIDVLVMMDAYMDDPALDGQTSGETLLPTTAAQGLMLDSASNALAGDGAKVIAPATIASVGNRLDLTYADAAHRTLATSLLSAAGRGSSWIRFSTPQAAAFGNNREKDEIVRMARVLNWENTAPEVAVVTLMPDAAGPNDLLNKYWTFSDGTTDWYVWHNDVTLGTGVDPAPAGFSEIQVDYDTGDILADIAILTTSAINASPARVIATAQATSTTLTMRDGGDVTNPLIGTIPAGWGVVVNPEGSAGTTQTLYFDRDIGFSLDGVGGAIVVAQAPAFQVFTSDLLFFHREKEIEGELTHFWYSAKSDPEGNAFSEVNFAYKLGQLCHDLTENETTVIGSIGVRPPSNHFNPAAVATWIGKSPSYDEDGDVTLNGSGLLGNKFLAGRGLNNIYLAANQFDPGFLATVSGELDDVDAELDTNGFQKDLGKYLSLVASWPTMTNASDSSGVGYIASGAALYSGLLAGLEPWRGTTAKPIGGSNVRLPTRLAKRHLNSLTGINYVLFTETLGQVTVVDGPSAALSDSDYTRNMTMRLVAEAITRLRDAGRPFLGDPLDAIRKSALETKLKFELNELQRSSGGALESFNLGVTQSPLDRVRGTAKVTVSMSIINELRKLTFDVALTL
jgi:hypothetical protein